MYPYLYIYMFPQKSLLYAVLRKSRALASAVFPKQHVVLRRGDIDIGEQKSAVAGKWGPVDLTEPMNTWKY